MPGGRLRWTALLFGVVAWHIDATAILFSLLQELQSEVAVSNALAKSTARWCRSTARQQTGVVEEVQRQLDNSATAARQIASDIKRLKSEGSLAETARKEKQQQLSEAVKTANDASTEFRKEKQELSDAVGVVGRVIGLVQAQMKARQQHGPDTSGVDGDSATGTAMLALDTMTSDEKKILSSYVGDMNFSDGGAHAITLTEMLQSFTELHARLEGGRSKSAQEYQALAQQLWGFADHLNSSILEVQSLSASIGIEMAQRRREDMRLNGQISDLSLLLRTVQASRATARDACSEEEQHRREVARYVTAESEAVSVALKQIPAESAELLLQPAVGDSPASFLQLPGRPRPVEGGLRGALRGLARRFPEEAAWYADAVERLPAASRHGNGAEDRGRGEKGRWSSLVATPSRGTGPGSQAAPSSGASAAIRDIEQLVQVPSGKEASREVGGGVYESLLARVRNKENTLKDQARWCASIVRDAKVDSDAVARSLRRANAKLSIMRATTEQYTKNLAYSREQAVLVAAQLQALASLSEDEEKEYTRCTSALGSHSKDLLQLAAEMGQKTTPEANHAANAMTSLMHRIELHQNKVQKWHSLSLERRGHVDAALRAVEKELSDASQRNKRRLVELKVETRSLDSLAHAKASDWDLGERYRKMSSALCSPEKVEKFAIRENELVTETKELRELAPGGAAAATAAAAP